MAYKEKIREKFEKSIDLAREGKNNDSIIKMCEAVMDMIAMQTDDACIVSVGFAEDLQKLYESGVISSETRQNYSAIIDLANQVNQGKTIPLEYVKEAAEILNDEIEICESSEARPINVDEELDKKANAEQSIGAIGDNQIRYDEDGNPILNNQEQFIQNGYNPQNGFNPNMQNMQNMQQMGQNLYAGQTFDGNNTFYPNGATQINVPDGYQNSFDNMYPSDGYNQARSNQGNFYNGPARRAGQAFSLGDILTKIFDLKIGKKNSIPPFVRILVPVVCVFLFVSVVRAVFFSGGPDSRQKRTSRVTTEAPTTESETIETTEPIIETTTEAGTYLVTKDEVRVREEPNTNATTKVYAYVNKGTEVQVDRFYNDEWALIKFDGKDLFISRSYISRKEE